jgi:hypothetical protein
MNLCITIIDSLHIPRMNRLLALNSQLEYWKELPIQHLFDPMHIMKNVCHSLLLHLQGAKDTNSRKDELEVSNTKHMLWQSTKYGVAPYVMLGRLKCIFPYNVVLKNTYWVWGSFKE